MIAEKFYERYMGNKIGNMELNRIKENGAKFQVSFETAPGGTVSWGNDSRTNWTGWSTTTSYINIPNGMEQTESRRNRTETIETWEESDDG